MSSTTYFRPQPSWFLDMAANEERERMTVEQSWEQINRAKEKPRSSVDSLRPSATSSASIPRPSRSYVPPASHQQAPSAAGPSLQHARPNPTVASYLSASSMARDDIRTRNEHRQQASNFVLSSRTSGPPPQPNLSTKPRPPAPPNVRSGSTDSGPPRSGTQPSRFSHAHGLTEPYTPPSKTVFASSRPSQYSNESQLSRHKYPLEDDWEAEESVSTSFLKAQSDLEKAMRRKEEAEREAELAEERMRKEKEKMRERKVERTAGDKEDVRQRKKEEQIRLKERELRVMEEDLQRRAVDLEWQEIQRHRKEQEIKRKAEMAERMQQEAKLRSEEAWRRGEEAKRRENELKKRQEEERRRQEEASWWQEVFNGFSFSSASSAQATSAPRNTAFRSTASSTAKQGNAAPAWTSWTNTSHSTNSTTGKPRPKFSAHAKNSRPISEEEWQRRQEEYAQQQFKKFREEQEGLERQRLFKEGPISHNDLANHEAAWPDIDVSELTWDSFPWPIPKKPFQPEEITFGAVSGYVLSHPQGTRKERVKELLRKWHPDRFETKWLTKVVERDKEKVKEGAGLVVRHLNELLTKMNGLGVFS